MGVYDYHGMDSAPKDGSVILVLRDHDSFPVAATWYAKTQNWRDWHTGDEIFPDYWCALPADAPSDYKPLPKNPKVEKVEKAGKKKEEDETDYLDFSKKKTGGKK